MLKWLVEKTVNRSLKNVLMLMSGTFLSQALPILFFPILSRLYTPADYGLLGIFMSVSMLIVIASNFQLNHAILIPKEEHEALKVLSSGCYLIIAFSLLSVMLLVFFINGLSNLLNTPEFKYWGCLLPPAIFFSGINVQLSSWFNRSGDFKIITASRVLTSVVTISVSLGLIFLVPGPGGLIIAYFAGTICGVIVLYSKFRRDNSFYRLPISDFRYVLKKYRNFPFYTLPTELISSFAQQLPLYIFSIYSGVQSVGWFSRSRQILGIPINYISNSVSEVYKQKASETFRNNAPALRPLFVKTIGYLFFLSIAPFLIVAVFSPSLFAFAFGENWRQAGVFTQCMALMYFFKFVISPLTFNFYLFGKQRLDFVLHLLIILFTVLGLFIGFTLFKSDVYALTLFSIAYAVMYLIYGFLSYRFTNISRIF